MCSTLSVPSGRSSGDGGGRATFAAIGSQLRAPAGKVMRPHVKAHVWRELADASPARLPAVTALELHQPWRWCLENTPAWTSLPLSTSTPNPHRALPFTHFTSPASPAACPPVPGGKPTWGADAAAGRCRRCWGAPGVYVVGGGGVFVIGYC
jgi:hypothetical protein